MKRTVLCKMIAQRMPLGCMLTCIDKKVMWVMRITGMLALANNDQRYPWKRNGKRSVANCLIGLITPIAITITETTAISVASCLPEFLGIFGIYPGNVIGRFVEIGDVF